MLGGALAALGLLVALIWGGVIPVNPLQVANAAKWIIVALAVFTFLRLFLFSDLTGVEKKRIGVVAVLFVAAVTFFAGLEQAGSSLNLFADQYTNRMLGSYEMPASWFQAINPLFVVLLGPVAAGVWVALSKRGRDLSLGMKFARGPAAAGGWAMSSSRWARNGRSPGRSCRCGCCSCISCTPWGNCASARWD